MDSSKFGKYTCRAENGLGEDQKTTEVSGKKNIHFLPIYIRFHSKFKFEVENSFLKTFTSPSSSSTKQGE